MDHAKKINSSSTHWEWRCRSLWQWKGKTPQPTWTVFPCLCRGLGDTTGCPSTGRFPPYPPPTWAYGARQWSSGRDSRLWERQMNSLGVEALQGTPQSKNSTAQSPCRASYWPLSVERSDLFKLKVAMHLPTPAGAKDWALEGPTWASPHSSVLIITYSRYFNSTP